MVEKWVFGAINKGATFIMNLDDAQTARVREWINQGLKVAEIQTRLSDELGLRLTYMEARLLLDDLQLRPKDAPARPAASAASGLVGGTPGGGAGAGTGGGPGAALTTPGGPPDKADPAGTAPPSGGQVSVSVDNLARPGALVSGKVTFRDGQAADWQLDQFGRLAVVPKKQGYKPSQADVMDFQAELESTLARLGY